MYLNYLRYVQQKCFSFPELLQYFLVRFDDNATFRRYEHFCVANLSDISYCLTLPWFMLWILTTSFLFAPVRTFSLTQSLACSHSLIHLWSNSENFMSFFLRFSLFRYIDTQRKRGESDFLVVFAWEWCEPVCQLAKHAQIFLFCLFIISTNIKPLEIVEWKILLLSRWSCRSRHRHRQRSIAAFA